MAPVATIGRSPWLLIVPADSPFKSVADLVAFGKANPGKLAFPFWQSSVLVTGETFARVAGVPMRKVPYKGAVESMTDLLGGRLPFMFTDTIAVRPQLAAGLPAAGETADPRGLARRQSVFKQRAQRYPQCAKRPGSYCPPPC
jgi:tripartite-type tricarboxylate transporter receptor subunit TctC